MKRRRKTGMALPKQRKWKLQRISFKTHRMLKDMKAHTDVPMSEFIERIVDHIYGGGLMDMQALAFFVIYLDGKPAFIVAAKDAETAENGLRQNMLGQKIGKVKAVSLFDADIDDAQRIGITAILSQLTQIGAMLQMLLSKGR